MFARLAASKKQREEEKKRKRDVLPGELPDDLDAAAKEPKAKEAAEPVRRPRVLEDDEEEEDSAKPAAAAAPAEKKEEDPFAVDAADDAAQ